MTKILIVNNADPGTQEFVKPLAEIVLQAACTPVNIEYAECLHFDFASVDGALLSGSPQGDDIVNHHLPYFQWVKTFNRPLLGICAGHHLTGYMYGAELLRSKEPESGDFEVEQLKEDPLFEHLPKRFIVKQMHNDSITLPDSFELLMTSTSCKNQLMKHKEKRLYTCQFHPEFYNHKLIRNFVNLCK